MGTFSSPEFLAVEIFFNALQAGLTNPHDISDSFNEIPVRSSSLDVSSETCSTMETSRSSERRASGGFSMMARRKTCTGSVVFHVVGGRSLGDLGVM